MKFLPILSLLTRYPFLRVSARFLAEEIKDLKQAFEQFPDTIDAGKLIVSSAIEGEKCERDFEEGDILCIYCENKNCTECKDVGKFEDCNLCLKCFENCKLEYYRTLYEELKLKAKLAILTYLSSRIIVSMLDDWVRLRYAVNEADYYSMLLDKESNPAVRFVARDLGIILKGWNVHVTSYVKASSRIRSDEWRLVNRRVIRGFVKTDRRDLIRIIKEILREKLSEKVHVEDLKEIFESKIKDLKRVSSKKKKVELDLGEVDINCFPPCMKEILSELQMGMNVPHSARFALTSFLINIGMKTDDIIKLFSTAPDFDEEKTRYQVEHIAGERGKGVEYTSPSCDTMRTYQNCISDCGVKHPLIFYKNCKSKKFKARKNKVGQ